ncbi:ABC transporter permease [Paenibacillus faecalis]|uniref:ABC transporter permease n=1 Tax=Paenibacillus faecalis TaxID=2079532 RepID=UPI000D10B5CF|nr:ABC transporter permease [Paenibacillus faecalis]
MIEFLSNIDSPIESGLLYALMALGVYITFRILNFPDLTVDGSFTMGGAIAAVLITNGVSPWLATLGAFCGGLLAGACTGLLHTKGKINGLLSGIIMMIALYSINMRILGKPNVSLSGENTIFSTLDPILLMAVIVIAGKLLLDVFFRTDLGLSLRATGDNKQMIRSFGVNTDTTTMLGLSLSNGLVALSGAAVAQQSSFADIGAGIGMIVIGLASVIIGEAVLGTGSVFRTTAAVVIGSMIYRIVVSAAYEIEWLESSDIKLITALIVIVALVVPTVRRSMKQRALARKRSTQLTVQGKAEGGSF